jgi:endonuclease III related protein
MGLNDSMKSSQLMDIYRRLYAHHGPQHWWPAESPFEVIVGAILTQSAAWSNVEKAIVKLKAADALNPEVIRHLNQDELAGLIHSCGYYNMKAKKLKAFVEWLAGSFTGGLAEMLAQDSVSLRNELLKVHGVGEETADSILLYAAQKPVFVIDTYTRRIVDRLGLEPEGERYTDYQQLFMSNLNPDVKMFSEYHALLVALGKNFCCKSLSLCDGCPLREICPTVSEKKN